MENNLEILRIIKRSLELKEILKIYMWEKIYIKDYILHDLIKKRRRIISHFSFLYYYKG